MQIQTQIHTKMMHSLKSQRQCRKLSCLVPFAVKRERCRSLHWLRVDTPHHRVLDAWCGFRWHAFFIPRQSRSNALASPHSKLLISPPGWLWSTLEQSEGYNFQGYHERTLVRRHVGGCQWKVRQRPRQRRERSNLLVTPLKKYGLWNALPANKHLVFPLGLDLLDEIAKIVRDKMRVSVILLLKRSTRQRNEW